MFYNYCIRNKIFAYCLYTVPVQTGSGTVSGNMGMPGPETKRSRVFGKIPDRDRDCGVWSGPDRVPIGPGPNFPNTTSKAPTVTGQSWLRTYGTGRWLSVVSRLGLGILHEVVEPALHDLSELELKHLNAAGHGRSLAIVVVETMDVELAVSNVHNVIILEVEHVLGMLDHGRGIRSNEKFNQLGDAILRHECTRLGVHQFGTRGPCRGGAAFHWLEDQ